MVRNDGLMSRAEMAVSVFPVSPQATTKETRQAQASDESESVTLFVDEEEEAEAPTAEGGGPTGGKEEEEEQEEDDGGEGDPAVGPPIDDDAQLGCIRAEEGHRGRRAKEEGGR